MQRHVIVPGGTAWQRERAARGILDISEDNRYPQPPPGEAWSVRMIRQFGNWDAVQAAHDAQDALIENQRVPFMYTDDNDLTNNNWPEDLRVAPPRFPNITDDNQTALRKKGKKKKKTVNPKLKPRVSKKKKSTATKPKKAPKGRRN